MATKNYPSETYIQELPHASSFFPTSFLFTNPQLKGDEDKNESDRADRVSTGAGMIANECNQQPYGTFGYETPFQ